MALKWAIMDKYHDYLYGSSFEVVTNNNPLTYILTSARLDATGHRWVAALSNYNFTIIYRSGKLNQDADALSRLPEPTEPKTWFTLMCWVILNSCHVLTEERPLAESLIVTHALHADAPGNDIPQDQLTALSLSSAH